MTDTLAQRLENHIITKGVSNDDLVQIIEVCALYLNLQTRSDYAKNNNVSYNGAKNYRHNVKIAGVNFIIDNE